MENAETIGDLLNQLKDVKLDDLDTTAGAVTALGWGGGWMSGWLGGFEAATHMWWNWAIGALMLVSTWVIFTKANKPGWAAIIPFYNIYVALEMIGKPWWWLLLLFVPFVNIVIAIWMCRELARVFGQDVAFTVGLVFLSFIFMPLLAFGDYKYKKPKAV
ncbi:MAG: DUF5684 domain-containing protein [Patescibacteria group bacterium]|jgi:hypothetical protein